MDYKLIGNAHNEKILTAWLSSGRLPHGILVEGAAGTGRKSFCEILGATILCTGQHPPCGECLSCKKMKKQIHPDFHLVEGSGGARSFHISQVREIRAEAWVAPNDGENKVFMLLRGEEMSIQAQNALLKLIEEPPKGVFFLLTCENRTQMLPTILSRMTALSMPIPSPKEVAAYLVEKGVAKEEAERVAEETGGNIGAALAQISDENKEQRNQGRILWQFLKERNVFEAAQLCSNYERKKESFLLLLEDFRKEVAKELISGTTKQGGGSPLQQSQILDTIDKVVLEVMSNVNLLLLATYLPSAIGRILYQG